jgi:hypothetical protein
MRVLILSSLLFLVPLTAFAAGDCDAELAEIDRRIATGTYPDMNVELARQMRNSLEQMCGMLDDSMRAQMMEGIEEVLPTMTPEEQRADKAAKKAAAVAARDERQSARPASAQPGTTSSAVPQTGRSIASGFVDRAEDMLHFWIWDWDEFDGKARVLYMTQPSRVQYGEPVWSRNIYVVEIGVDGKSTQRLITSKQAHENWTVALRRGRDEVILQRQTGGDGNPTTLERWSVAGRKMLSSVTTPAPTFEYSDKVSWHHFATPTSDGNVMFVNAFEPQRGSFCAAWYKVSPEGRILGQGQLAMDGGSFSNLSPIAAGNGNAVLPVLLGTERHVTRRFGSTEVGAKVMHEMRLLTMRNDGSSSTSAVIGTMILPEITDLNGLAYSSELEHALMANRNIESLDIAPRSLPAMQPIGDAYLMLTKLVGDRSRPEPIHGHWLVWVDDERIEREVYLDPLAKELNIDFKLFDIAPSGDIVLYGNSQENTGTDYLVVLDQQGKPRSKTPVRQPKNGSIKALIADDAGAWLFGNGYPTDKFSHYRFWFERIELD